MFFRPSYDPYSRFGSSSPSFGRQELARRQRMEEERRRRAEIERRQRTEAELARRRQFELLRREPSDVERSRRQRFAEKPSSQRKVPSYRIVRGPDGNLYRVPLEERNDAVKSQTAENGSRKNSPSYQIVRGPDGRYYRVPCGEREDVRTSQPNENPDTKTTPSYATSENREEEVVSTKSESKENDDITEWHECQDIDDGSQKEPSERNGALPPNILVENVPDEEDDESKANDNVTEWHECQDIDDGSHTKSSDENGALPPKILVENVPDEEDEELREMRSIWRNRTPSPGQWMEPVEIYRN